MAGNGGARPGAGRPRGSKNPATQVDARIRGELLGLIDNLLALANGVLAEDSGKDGQPKVYSRPPDRLANVYLINRVLGRPNERTEVRVGDSPPTPITIIEVVRPAGEPEPWRRPTEDGTPQNGTPPIR